MRKVAVTGDIACGKTSVCEVFRELGAFVVSADEIVHELLSPGTEIAKIISSLLKVDEGISFRKNIAKKVFKDLRLLEKLEKILHPGTLKKIETLSIDISKKEDYKYFIVEVPLLFEIQHQDFFDTIITVTSNESEAKKRFQDRGFTIEDYRLRMRRQLPLEEKVNRSHFVIENNGSFQDLKNKVNQILQEL